MIKNPIVFLALALAECGTFKLADGVQGSGKTPEQLQLDTLTCKVRAHLSSESARR
jgi:hypothetical protein